LNFYDIKKQGGEQPQPTALQRTKIGYVRLANVRGVSADP
jgi:hypothetical protein